MTKHNYCGSELGELKYVDGQQRKRKLSRKKGIHCAIYPPLSHHGHSLSRFRQLLIKLKRFWGDMESPTVL